MRSVILESLTRRSLTATIPTRSWRRIDEQVNTNCILAAGRQWYLVCEYKFLLAQSEPAKLDGTSKEAVGEEVRDELDQLLDDTKGKLLTYSPDKRLLAHLDRHKVTIWSVEESRQLQRFLLEGRSLAAAFSPDGGAW